MTDTDEQPPCSYPHGRRCTEDGCDEPATAKRPEGVTPDGCLITVAVCDQHRAVTPTDT